MDKLMNNLKIIGGGYGTTQIQIQSGFSHSPTEKQLEDFRNASVVSEGMNQRIDQIKKQRIDRLLTMQEQESCVMKVLSSNEISNLVKLGCWKLDKFPTKKGPMSIYYKDRILYCWRDESYIMFQGKESGDEVFHLKISNFQ